MTAEFPLAVHALVYLLHKNQLVSSQELADNICTNPARVRKVMAKLNRAGLSEVSRGQGSGYLTRPDAAHITLSEILSALGEEAISMSWASGSIDMDCLIASGMGEIMDGLYARLNEACRLKLSEVTIGSINNRIFKESEGEK